MSCQFAQTYLEKEMNCCGSSINGSHLEVTERGLPPSHLLKTDDTVSDSASTKRCEKISLTWMVLPNKRPELTEGNKNHAVPTGIHSS